MIEIILFCVLGVGVGIFGSLVGVGGGLILIPIFVMFMTPQIFQTAQQAIGTSLFAVLLNAISGTYAYLRQKKVFLHAAIRFGLATVPGAFLGSYISNYFNGPVFSACFGVFLMCMAAIMFFKKKAKSAEDFNPKTFKYNQSIGIVLSCGVGFISSILGVGGGVIHVPMMISLLAFPPHVATATSTCVLGISSFIGVISHTMLNHILWVPALTIGFGAMIGAQIGAKIAKKTKPRMLIVLLCTTMVIVGAKLIVSAL